MPFISTATKPMSRMDIDDDEFDEDDLEPGEEDLIDIDEEEEDEW